VFHQEARQTQDHIVVHSVAAVALAALEGAGALLAGALRAGRREEGGGAGGTTSVLARTVSGDVQPRAWLAA
jgi:hypothetical protein